MITREHKFDWSLLGDISSGRPHLGAFTRLEVYRLMQKCFQDVLEQRLGAEDTTGVFYDAGYLAGQHFYGNMMGEYENLGEFLHHLQDLMRDLGIGILRVEEADEISGRLVLTVSEDLECSGLPTTEHTVCTYDEGFIAAVLERYSQVPFQVREVDCWCTGERTCRFVAEAIR